MTFYCPGGTNLDAQLDVLPSIHVHAGVQQPNLPKEFPVDHEGAADHGRGPAQERSQQSHLGTPETHSNRT